MWIIGGLCLLALLQIAVILYLDLRPGADPRLTSEVWRRCNAQGVRVSPRKAKRVMNRLARTGRMKTEVEKRTDRYGYAEIRIIDSPEPVWRAAHEVWQERESILSRTAPTDSTECEPSLDAELYPWGFLFPPKPVLRLVKGRRDQ